jgi:hypothetical protein
VPYNIDSENALSNLRLLEQSSPKPKVEVFIPMHETLQVSKCKKCGKIITHLSLLLSNDAVKLKDMTIRCLFLFLKLTAKLIIIVL